MAHAFQRHEDGYAARLDSQERSLLISLLEQVHTLLAPPTGQSEDTDFAALMRSAGLTGLGESMSGGADMDDLDDPDRDPCLDRLLPDAHREDPLISAEFRRMSAPGLRARKALNLSRSIEMLQRAGSGPAEDEMVLDEDEAQAFAVALTDLRLVIADRLDLRTDADSDRLDEEFGEENLSEETAWMVPVYHFAAWLQETLVESMLSGLDARESEEE